MLELLVVTVIMACAIFWRPQLCYVYSIMLQQTTSVLAQLCDAAGKLYMAHKQGLVPGFKPVPLLFRLASMMQPSNHDGVSVVNDKARTVNSMA